MKAYFSRLDVPMPAPMPRQNLHNAFCWRLHRVRMVQGVVCHPIAYVLVLYVELIDQPWGCGLGALAGAVASMHAQTDKHMRGAQTGVYRRTSSRDRRVGRRHADGRMGSPVHRTDKQTCRPASGGTDPQKDRRTGKGQKGRQRDKQTHGRAWHSDRYTDRSMNGYSDARRTNL